MAKKIKIFKRDGTPTPYFWSDKDRGAWKTVYKQTTDGVKKMTGVSFNAEKQQMRRV